MFKLFGNWIGIVVLPFVASFDLYGQSGPYQVNWVNQIGVTASSGVLTKESITTGWNNAGANSSNMLAAGTDGWLEFSVFSGANFIVGLSLNDLIDYTEFSYGVRIDHTNNSAMAFEGPAATSLGSWQAGDIFRVSREGSVVRYYQNGIEKRSLAVNANLVLKGKVSILIPGKSSPVTETSFDSQLIFRATVTPSDGGSTGSISVDATGGTPPYTYSWSSGEQTGVINKSPGLYTLTANDAAGHTLTREYAIGNRVGWIYQTGVNTTGNVLSKMPLASGWTNGGAVTSNLLSGNADGWLEFTLAYGAEFIIGFAVNNAINSTEFVNGIRIDPATNTAFAHEGPADIISLGTCTEGDVFRISREGSSIKYYRNGTVLRSVTINPALVLKIKASIRNPGKTTPEINTSFDCAVVIQGTVTPMDGNTGSGDISISAFGGTAPYTYDWTDGEQTSSISNKPPGIYDVLVTDVVGRTNSRQYTLGYKVNWTNQIGVTTSGSILTKMPLSIGWTNAGGVTSNVLAANTNGWIEFSADSGSEFIIGLATNNTISSTSFTNGIFVDYATSSVYATEGATAIPLGNCQGGDVFRISRDGNAVKYLRNGVVLRSVTVNPALILKIKASLKSTGKSTPNITTSFYSSDGIVRTYYAIADGLWTNPAIWSLQDAGAPAGFYPSDFDKVIIKGYAVTVNGQVKSGDVSIISINQKTSLKVEGNNGFLTVRGNVVMKCENHECSDDILKVLNNGRLSLITP